jgi:hypothetical protein
MRRHYTHTMRLSRPRREDFCGKVRGGGVLLATTLGLTGLHPRVYPIGMKDKLGIQVETGDAARPVIGELHCKRPTCGWRWYPRSTKPPKVCPHCKCRDWARDPTALPPQVAASLTALERGLLETFLEFRKVAQPLVVRALVGQMKLHIRLAEQGSPVRGGADQRKK